MNTSAIRAIKERLQQNKLCTSDAITELLPMLRERAASESLVSVRNNSLCADILTVLHCELIGYDQPKWALSGPYRRCRAETFIKDNNNRFKAELMQKNCCFIAVWGTQQIESFLSDIIDIEIFRCGRQELIDHYVNAVIQKNLTFITESDVDPDVGLRVQVFELIRIYFEIQRIVCKLCDLLVESLETGCVTLLSNSPVLNLYASI